MAPPRASPNCARPSPRTSRAPAASHVGPQHVSVVPGGKPIIFFPMLALLEPGDEVIYPNPGFPIYESMIRFMRRHPGAAAAGREPRLLLRPEPLRAPA